MNSIQNDNSKSAAEREHRKMIIGEKLELLREVLQDLKDYRLDRATTIKQTELGLEILGRLSQVFNQ